MLVRKKPKTKKNHPIIQKHFTKKPKTRKTFKKTNQINKKENEKSF